MSGPEITPAPTSRRLRSVTGAWLVAASAALPLVFVVTALNSLEVAPGREVTFFGLVYFLLAFLSAFVLAPSVLVALVAAVRRPVSTRSVTAGAGWQAVGLLVLVVVLAPWDGADYTSGSRTVAIALHAVAALTCVTPLVVARWHAATTRQEDRDRSSQEARARRLGTE